MIDFGRAPLLLPADPAAPESRRALPPLPRAQLGFWGAPVLLSLERPTPKPRRALERFRTWLGRDPATMDRDDVYAALVAFRAIRKRFRKLQDGPQQELPTVARKISKPRSLGLLPTGAERRAWIKPLHLAPMPRTRAECPEQRPCTFVRCRYHLKLEVLQDNAKRLEDGTTTAPIKDLFPLYTSVRGRDGVTRERYVYPGMPLDQMPATCALDVAHEGPRTNEQVGAFLSVVDERTRQEFVMAVDEVHAKVNAAGEHEDVEVTRDEIIGVLRFLGKKYQREK